MNTKSLMIVSVFVISLTCHGSLALAADGLLPINDAQKLGWYDAWQKFCKPDWTKEDRAKMMRYNHIVENNTEEFFRDYFKMYHIMQDYMEIRETNNLCYKEKMKLNNSGVWF